MSTRKLVMLGLLSAMGFLLMFLIEFPLPFLPPYLKYDPGEVTAIVGAGLFGPVAGVWVIVGKTILFFLSGKASDGIIGVSASLVAGIGLTVGATIAYKSLKGQAKLVGGVVGGALGITVLMSLANYFVFLPLYGIPKDQLWTLTLTAVVPFNLVKGFLSSLIGLVVYEKVLIRIPWIAKLSGIKPLKNQYQH